MELQENQAIREGSPALWEALSPLGRRLAYPRDIPFQAAEARGKAFNGTIGQITDGRGGPLPLPSVAAALAGLEPAERSAALLYSPVPGLPEVRDAWRAWQRRGQPDALASSRPLVTVGLTHGLSLVADLFGGEGRTVAVADPFWGNYRQTFATRTGARLATSPAYRGGRFDPRFVERALEGLPRGEPALAIANFPSNPGGYSPTAEERTALIDSLLREATRRPLVVVCDDAYAGLVYDEGVPAGSLFWELQAQHPNLVPIKVDGATKEFSFFGGRVGFLTFPFAPDSPVAAALDSKAMCLLRATLGSPVAASQAVLLRALRSPGVEGEIAEVRELLGRRCRALRAALERHRESLAPLPFNAGCFAVIELPEGKDAGAVRRLLLAEHDTGVVSLGERFLRIAFCSVAEDDLAELVARVARGVARV